MSFYSERQERETQFALDHLCADYAAAAEFAEMVGNPTPDLTPFMERANALGQAGPMAFAAFVVDWHLMLRDMPAPDETPEAELSPAFERALARIRVMERECEQRQMN